MKSLIIFSLIGFSAFAYENCTSENTSELERCSYGNYKAEDELLNYLYGEIGKSFPEIKGKVRASQRLWIKARDEICSYTSDDGAEYQINKNICLYQQTYERNRELKAILTKEANKGVSQSISLPRWDEYVKYHCEFMAENFSDAGCKERNQFLHSE